MSNITGFDSMIKWSLSWDSKVVFLLKQVNCHINMQKQKAYDPHQLSEMHAIFYRSFTKV